MSATKVNLTWEGEPIALRARRDGDRLQLWVGEERCDVTLRWIDAGACDVMFADGTRRRVAFSRRGDARWVSVGAHAEVASVERGRGALAQAAAGGLASPMPGRVVAVEVAEGDRVEEGQVLVRVEAMKMEHAIRAPHPGTVARLRCAAGDAVEGGAPLLELDTEDEAGV